MDCAFTQLKDIYHLLFNIINKNNLPIIQAYRHHSSSVKIAKIIALTVIASSFIIGSFILASTYLQAKATCDQMQTLDSVLERELMLEALQQVRFL